MNALKRLLRWLESPQEAQERLTARKVYDFGYQNGFACGEVVGRKQAFVDILEHLAIAGRTLEELLPADVVEVRTKSTH